MEPSNPSCGCSHMPEATSCNTHPALTRQGLVGEGAALQSQEGAVQAPAPWLDVRPA